MERRNERKKERKREREKEKIQQSEKNDKEKRTEHECWSIHSFINDKAARAGFSSRAKVATI